MKTLAPTCLALCVALYSAFAAGEEALHKLPPADAPQLVPLWPDKPPQFLENGPAEFVEKHGIIRNVTVPSLSVFAAPPEKRTGMAIIVCAGGGYGALDWQTHVVYTARGFNPLGVTVIGLKYRLRPPHMLDNPGIQALTLLDVKRAVRRVTA